jgi:carbonic anhydrase
MDHLRELFAANKRWVAEMTDADPEFFRRRAGKQEPQYLFIGCSDSRVPANLLTGAQPGELFVHRNIANQIYPGDMNALSVIEYAVDVLNVPHVIVCGHYGCGGVEAAMGTAPLGLLDHWLGGLRNVIRLHRAELDAIPDHAARARKLVDLNALEQVYNLSKLPVIQRAWARGATPLLHGLAYDINDGLLHPLALGVDSPTISKLESQAGRT